MADRMIGIVANGIEMPVSKSVSPSGKTGIAFAAQDGVLLISITSKGKGFAVALKDDGIDQVAGKLADAIMAATNQSASAPRTVQ